MIRSGREKERHTIPRWNSIETGQQLGELDPINYREDNHDFETSVEVLLNEWKNEKTLPLAIEILSESDLTNSSADISEIIDYVKTKVQNKSGEVPLVKLLLNEQSNQVEILPTKHSKIVSNIKTRLASNPHNPLLWTDLAREYLILGLPAKCEKALLVARNLSPDNRTVLRAVARFYTHEDDYEKAQYYLAKSQLIRRDPWVLASEIAISNEQNKTSRFIKNGIQLLENNNINPRARSELAAELATMDFSAANSKNGKRKLYVACISPHENAVAQIAWNNEKTYKIPSILDEIKKQPVDCNFEAETGWYIQQKAWNSAIDIAGQWQKYQPFSRTPALIKSEIALNYADKFTEAIQSLEEALLSNPNDISLLNNLAYAYALQGNELKMRNVLHIASTLTVIAEDPVLTATNGLYQYRFGDPEKGKELYQFAIKKADYLGQPEISYAATIYLAREELLCNHDVSNLLAILTKKKNESYFKAYKILIEEFKLPL